MKRYFFVIVIFFCIVIVNATPILKIEHSTYQPKETLFATISTQGSFLEELKTEDITFFEGRKQVFFEHNLYYYNGIYYLDVIFNKEGTFIIKTPEILFNLAGEVGSTTLEKTISVYYDNYDNQTNTYTDILSIKPGIIYTISNKSELKLFNRGTNQLSIKIGDISTSIEGLQAQTIYLNIKQSLTHVTFSSYKTFSVPIIYLGLIPINTTTQEGNQTTIEIKKTELIINPKKIEVLTSPNQSIVETINLENRGENEITDIKILTEISTTTIEVPDTISPQSSEGITITITSEYESFINDTIIINYIENETEYNKTIPIIIYISKENETEIPDAVEITCGELSGEICDGECDGESEFTIDGYCCIGKCVERQTPEVETSSNDSYGWIVGILIFIIIGIIGYFVYKKYNKTKPESPETKLDKSKEDYEKRLGGQVKNKMSRH